jgi:hypothetical protein
MANSQHYIDLPVPRNNLSQLSVLAFWSLVYSFREAAGANRLDAAHALRWIRASLDWTKIPLSLRLQRWGAPGPPKSVRAEFALSFSWCCAVLGLNEDRTRRHGLPRGRNRRDSYMPTGGLADWRTWRARRGQSRLVPAPVLEPHCAQCGQAFKTKRRTQKFCCQRCVSVYQADQRNNTGRQREPMARGLMCYQ